MKKLISLTLALIMCLSVFSVAAFATEVNTRNIASVELHTVKYYEAVHKESEIASAALYVNFLVYYTDGTTALYDSKKGWDDATVTSEVSWYIKPETDENYGGQQSLYITVDGTDYWACYVDVEVDSVKATFRNIITWDWMTPEEKVEATHWLFKLLKSIFAALRDLIGGSDAYGILYNIFDAFDKFVYDNFPLETDVIKAS